MLKNKIIILLLLLMTSYVSAQGFNVYYSEVVFDTSDNLSNVIRLDVGRKLAGLEIPSGVSTAYIKFMVGSSADNLSLLQKDGEDYQITLDPTKNIRESVDPTVFFAWRYIQLVIDGPPASQVNGKVLMRSY